MMRVDAWDCQTQVMSAKAGLVNFTTLKGLSAYKKATTIQSTYAPACSQKYDSHLEISTIPKKFQELCVFVPKEWQPECKARSIGCLTTRDYPYDDLKLNTCLQ